MGSGDISTASLPNLLFVLLLLAAAPGAPSPTCQDPQPLGLQSGTLPSSSLSASSSHSPMVGADMGRLHSEEGGGAWCPKGQVGPPGSDKETDKEWIQVDLEPGTVVTGVVVQGRWAGGQGREWADKVVVEVWVEETNNWVELGGPRPANSDTYTAVELSLGAIATPRLRVLPVSAHPRTVCLRLEVLGCQGESSHLLIWEDEYMAAIIGALVTVIVCLTAIIVFILWRNSTRTSVKDEVLQCNTPGPGSSSSSQSCYTSSYTESNEPVYASSSYNESTEYAAPLLISNNHCSMDWATFFPPPPTSTPPLPHLLPGQLGEIRSHLGEVRPHLGEVRPHPLPPQPHSPRPLPPSPRPPSSHYAASNIIWAGRRGDLGKQV